MKLIKNYLRFFTSVLCGLAVVWSCESDLNPDDPGNPTNPNNPNLPANIDPDKASRYLVLDSATQITGTPGGASDGQIKMDVEDTIFAVKGYPLGSRIHFSKDTTQNISGYYVHVSGASSYYDVPETIIDGQYEPTTDEDTSSVLVLDLDPTVDNVDYPFTIEVIIQPHDPSGNPLDEFTRWVTVEDPEDGSNGGCNTITGKVWEWNFSFRVYNDEILNVFAPGLATPINSQGGGCCTSQGKSLTVSSPLCAVGIQEPNVRWVEVTPNDYSVRPYQYLQFGDDGSALADGLYIVKNWDLTTTDFCSNRLGYTYNVDENQLVAGTHDFSPGANSISFDFPNWQGGWRPQDGQIVYTCNVLVIIYGVEDQTFVVYKNWDGTQIEYTEVIWHD